jgi:prepilin-type N-terminal cleavage/methylation domain-containing protein
VKGRAGFSLVEMMIVVAIIGMLASIGWPQYRYLIARAQAKIHLTALNGGYTSVRSVAGLYGQFPITIGVTATSWLSIQANSANFVNCAALVVTPGDLNSQAVKDLCETMPPFPDFVVPANSGCGDPTLVGYMYTGSAKDYKLIGQCVAPATENLLYAYTGALDPRRDGGSNNTLAEPATSNGAWAFGYNTPGAAGW